MASRKKQAKKTSIPEEYSCARCNEPDSMEDMVACDRCEKWFHYSCALVNVATVHTDDFLCDGCKSNEVTRYSQQGSQTGRVSSLKSATSSTQSEKLLLKLQQLEEAQALRMKHEQQQRSFREARLKLLKEEEQEQLQSIQEESEYLAQKHQLELAQLEEQETDGRSGRTRSYVSVRSSRSRVEEWITGQSQISSERADLEYQTAAKPGGFVEPVHSSDITHPANSSFTPGIPSQSDYEQDNRKSTVNLESRYQQADKYVQHRKQQSPLGILLPKNVPQISIGLDHKSTASTVSSSTMFLSLPHSGEQLVQQHFHPNTDRVSKLSLANRNQILRNQQDGQCGQQRQNVFRTTIGLDPKSTASSLSDSTRYLSLPPSGEQPVQQHFHSNIDRMSKLSLANRNPKSTRVEPLTTTRELGQNRHLPGPTMPLERIDQPRTIELTRDKIAARQVMPKELPQFDGNPEEWPMFLSCYKMTTEACGYSDVENLMRLQRSLKGVAMEAVRSRLLIPSSVPSVLNTLQMLFGKPELVINTLLKKVREVPAPKPERLDMLITFGMAVQNLCDHLEAAEMSSHLCNPVLLQELIDKLPAGYRMDWARYRKQYSRVNLRTFGDFMETLVLEANSVTLQVFPEWKGSRMEHLKQKNKAFVNAHDAKFDSSNQPHMEFVNLCTGCKNEEHGVATCETFQKLSVQDRWKMVHKLKLCRQCLGRHGKIEGQWNCPSGENCGIDGCSRTHNKLLHSTPTPRLPEHETTAIVNHHRMLQAALFRIIPITLHGKNSIVHTYAMLDDGSSVTLLEENLAKLLEIEGEADPLCLVWTANKTRTEHNSRRMNLEVSGYDSKDKYPLVNARTVSELVLPKQTMQASSLIDAFPHLEGIPIEGYKDAIPQVLIGFDNAHLLTPMRSREGRIGEPIAVKTRLGWSVFGGTASVQNAVNYHGVKLCDCYSDDQLQELVKRYFAVDALGVESIRPVSDDEKRARKILEDTTVRVSGRFETGLIWRYDVFEFPASYEMAIRRLQCLERKLKRDENLYANVRRQIEEYQHKGYAHKATVAEMKEMDPKRTWYLPLGVVVNPKKPSKVRLIWDASATVEGVSLNSMLLKGPDLLIPLPAVVGRFRQRCIAVVGDIQEMYHQFFVRRQDRSAQCFVFRNSSEEKPDTYIMDVATFGSCCSPSSAQYIKNKNAEDHAEKFPRAAEAIIKSHYVDDLLDSCDTVDDAVQLMLQVKEIHAAGGFHIRGWMSNNAEVLERVGENCAEQEMTVIFDKTETVLGMIWIPKDDVFTFSKEVRPNLQDVVYGEKVPTKREALRCVMSVFDPLGLIAFFVFYGKVILQDIWRSGIGWDDEVPENILEHWKMWTQLFNQLDTVKVNRCYFTVAQQPSEFELHVFVDASELAYACVAYFRVVIDGKPRCAFVAGKSKVASLKAISIPRLELQAAVLGTRLAKTVGETHSLPITKRYFWTDSQTVLAWIRSDSRRYRQFVGFRIGEILTKTEVNEWRYVPSNLNVADDATKWKKLPSFEPENRWFTGPNFLHLFEGSWPNQDVLGQDSNEAKEELRACNIHQVDGYSEIIDCSRFSKWERMWRALGYVFRFVENCKRKCMKMPTQGGPLIQDELVKSETFLLRMAQASKYPDEVAVLTRSRPKTGGQMVEKSSPLYKLSPFADENGVIRLDGRIKNAPTLPEDTKFPVILPKDHAVTSLILDSYHRRFLHGNKNTVLNEVKQRYYVSTLRTLVDRVIKQCIWCKVYKSLPTTPRMAALPAVRLTPSFRPFSFVGVDYFGPILVKVGRSNEKRWVCLFTCLTIRAVHMEVTYSLSTEACKMAIRRFVARRGAPLEFYSDNGTNFHGANNELLAQLDQSDIAESFTNVNTKWIFNPPEAPHMGGAWERMVRSVKIALETMPAYRKPNDETLTTVIAEAESIVNSRPLTFVPLDSDDQEAITPNHFLLLNSTGVKQPPKAFTEDRLALRRDWELGQNLVDYFWRRWVQEYLPSLTRRTKWFDDTKPVELGDLVVLVGEKKRNDWIRGRIAKVITAADGRARRVEVQTSSGVLKRPVSKVAVLDVLGKTGVSDQCYGLVNVASTNSSSSKMLAGSPNATG